ncbi:MoxR-like ATPase [Spinactinospora alkalitolerans]|uniref:MoxR-like ATPase n=1 Tax=Spinactinospora alkalitolerans TaxID=687207 RepID=A0A852U3P8_9ACTN|nr:MoxR family ATPase [Spinactinospora alkalitolerans]NYE48580.1 MoxR-like ATPase [Spinactinospora alkalitolerans]
MVHSSASDDGHPDAPGPTGDGHRSARPAERADPGWWIYRGSGRPGRSPSPIDALPPPPPWRRFHGGPALPGPTAPDPEMERVLGPADNPAPRHRDPKEIDAVNAALYLRRPLLVTGRPGVGKSTLAYRVSRELGLGRVLRWSINSRSTVRSGLYEYDPIARVHDISAAGPGPGADGAAGERHPIGSYIRLGPLGTAMLAHARPRVLVIDEFDKSDIDLANDLLDVLETGSYRIPELARISETTPEAEVRTDDPGGTAAVRGGAVTCSAFPFIVITSNGEREFPPPFLRRCLALHLDDPDPEQLADIIAAHLDRPEGAGDRELIARFIEARRSREGLAVDQLLNSVFLATSMRDSGGEPWDEEWFSRVLTLLWHRLAGSN